MEEGTITLWHKKEGEQVTKGEPLYNVMTDKADIEQEAPESGILRKILVPVDEIAPIGALLAVIGTADESIDSVLGASATPQPAAATGEEATPAVENSAPAAAIAAGAATEAVAGTDGDRIFASPRARRVAEELGIEVAQLRGRGTGIDGRIVEIDILTFNEGLIAARKAGKVTPLAQKVAAELGVDISTLTGAGTGHGGKVVSDDVRKAGQPAPAPTVAVAPIAPAAVDEVLKVIPLTGMRKMIADNVARSASTAPHVTLTVDVDMTEATAFRKKVLASVEKTDGVRISFTDIIAKAVAKALSEHPTINSTLVDNKVTQYRAVHLGIAVSLGEGGLVVPTIRNAESKTLPQISAEIKSKAAKAREGKLTTDEMIGGTFSITNLGTYGVKNFNPIINPPQCAILGVCTIADTIIPVGGVPQVRPVMNLCLSFDHRITDGAPAAAFLARLKELLELPYLIFM
jgi:pyruvate dehydrogenase E2 component (dihydrolipoamide acetyltransferase)